MSLCSVDVQACSSRWPVQYGPSFGCLCSSSGTLEHLQSHTREKGNVSFQRKGFKQIMPNYQ